MAEHKVATLDQPYWGETKEFRCNSAQNCTREGREPPHSTTFLT